MRIGLTVAELIAALQSHDPEALAVVMPFNDPALVEFVTEPRATTIVRNGSIVWREYDAVRGTPTPAVVLFDGH